ncbi:hypothetical protein [Aphanothece sacrum]|uniref:Flagellar biosynthesis protein FliR n=1 Tax=Aphanothece sacrum FPU1 TaxID=1920663 RepID=A0A401IFY3_APHSA|nr:hypothetical protein [Aphanothece sacrum]GBF80188.1 flagellar biosynthesis protein FliR [Aphanothece sacrum FPU1]GBF85341.1 flagellar biosynthesis protein FliR [Aphanothece sacrum FPU3]
MEFNELGLWLMLMFNALLCLWLPRILTLDWSNLFSGNQKDSQPQLDAVIQEN